MIWRLVARMIAAIHISYTLFVVVGSLLVLAWPGLLWLHLIAVFWAGATLGFDLGCPLTPWEKRFWRNGGVEPYPEGFLQHHVLHTRFNPATERRNHILLGGGAVLFNLLVYLAIWLRSR